MNARPNFFQRNKCALIAGITAFGKELLNNYWLFHLPLVGKSDVNASENAGYMITQAASNALLWTMVGMVLDRTPRLHSNTENTNEMGRSYQAFNS